MAAVGPGLDDVGPGAAGGRPRHRQDWEIKRGVAVPAPVALELPARVGETVPLVVLGVIEHPGEKLEDSQRATDSPRASWFPGRRGALTNATNPSGSSIERLVEGQNLAHAAVFHDREVDRIARREASHLGQDFVRP